MTVSGAVTFGGGQAMLPILKRELVTNLHWLTMKQFLYFVSVSQVTPGPVSVNMATFIGYEVGGIFGAITATTGVATPSFIIITVIATGLKKVSSSAVYKAFITGIKPVIVTLLIGAIYLIAKGGFHTAIPFVMAIIAFVVFMKFKINAFLFLIAMGTIGIFLIR
jgi:chromate transporter